MASKRLSVCGAPVVGEAALYELIEQGYYDAHLRALPQELDRRFRHYLTLLRHHMPEGTRWTTPGRGPVPWVECPRRVWLPKLVERMRARGVVLTLSESALFGDAHLHGFKLGYTSSASETERAVEILALAARPAVSGVLRSELGGSELALGICGHAGGLTATKLAATGKDSPQNETRSPLAKSRRRLKMVL